MQFIADLHLHSKYSRAVSQQMILPIMAKFAQEKGLDILSATDFTHPLWFKEISGQLEEDGEGMYILKSEYRNPKSEINSIYKNIYDKNEQTYFILSTEIACIYKQGEKVRRIHNLIFAPSLQTVEEINGELVKRGCNLSADGRPIIGLSARNLLELILSIDERCFLIPCHIWTPHFGLLGSASGFDSIEEAFGDLSKYIYGIETGLSSDPDMNWSIAELRNRSIISTSDAHSAPKMGREATAFELAGDKPTYSALKEAIMFPMKRGESTRSTKGIKGSDKTTFGTFDTLPSFGASRIIYTVEFYPEEGKYHFSGHRNCKVSYGPEETLEKGTVCPVCRRRMTEGVLVRVQQLADRVLENRAVVKTDDQGVQWHTDRFAEQTPYVKLVPLLEIIAESLHSTVNSQRVKEVYVKLCGDLQSELNVLLNSSINDIEHFAGSQVAAGVAKVRAGDLYIIPGYDGEYGKVKIWKGEGAKRVSSHHAVSDSQLKIDF